jgi:catechol O-methyltransferase
VLDAIDAFGSKKYLMNVGGPKAVLVEDIIRERQPKVCSLLSTSLVCAHLWCYHVSQLILELGTYVGYSAVAFGRHLKTLHPNGVPPSSWSTLPSHTTDTPHPRVGYFCLEQNEEYAAVAQVAIDIAGLGDYVHILVGSSSATLRELRDTLSLPTDAKFDFVFLDHYKP